MAIRHTFPRQTSDQRRKLYERLPYAKAGRVTAAAGFDYPATSVGTTPDGLVAVYYDSSLGSQGQALAQNLLATAQATFAQCAAWFGIAGSPCQVVIAPLSGTNDGSGGAYHYGCDFSSGGVLYLDASFGNDALELGLFVAELTECFMGAQGKGWGCGFSNGEALSRFLAEQVSGGPNGALSAFSTGPSWYNGGKANWIDTTENTDQDDVATGCGVLYLYWLVSLGYSIAQITQAGGATLAANYQALTGKSTAWADFSAAVATLSGVNGDNPWPASSPNPPPQPPMPPPAPPPAPGPTPAPTPAFTLTFPRDYPAGTRLRLTLATDVKKGTYDCFPETSGINVIVEEDSITAHSGNC